MWQAMALAWCSASAAWLASGPGIKQLLCKRNCRNCLHNRLKPIKYQTVPGTEQAPSEDGLFSLCFLSRYSREWYQTLLAAHPDSSLLPSPDNRTSLSSRPLGVCVYVCEGVCVCALSRAWLYVTPWTVARQAPLSMEFFWQEYWSALPFPTPGDLPNPGIKPASLVPPQTVGPT